MAPSLRRRRPDAITAAAEPPQTLPDALPVVARPPALVLARRRRDVRNAYQAQSRAIAEFVEGMTAAAQVYGGGRGGPLDGPAQPNAVARTWQHAAFGYCTSVPELKSAMMYVGNCMSRCKLVVGKRNADGTVEDAFEGQDPVPGLDAGILADASDIIGTIRARIGGQSELMRNYGEKMFIAGELYLVPEDSPVGVDFEVLSTLELVRQGDQFARYLGPGFEQKVLDPKTKPIRVWRPSVQYHMMADSSVRSCLEILEELVILTRLVRASAISRMAIAGILFIPDELDFPEDDTAPDGQLSEAMSGIATDLINTASKAIDDPAAAAAYVPFMIQGPAVYGEHIRYITFKAQDTEHVIQRKEALERLAQGLDIEPQVILGLEACVDEDTEILTDRGWLRYDDVIVGDEALTLDHSRGVATWQTIDRVSVYESRTRPMVSLEGRHHSSLSTLDHRWPVLSGRGKERWITSGALRGHHRILGSAPCADVPTEPKFSDAFVELVAWFWTEGTAVDGKGVQIYQSHVVHPDECARIRLALTMLYGPPIGELYGVGRAESVCSFPDCGGVLVSNGLCGAHDAQRRRGLTLRPVRRLAALRPPKVGRPAWREFRTGRMTRFYLNRLAAEEVRAVAPKKVVASWFIRSLTESQLRLFIETSVDGDGSRWPSVASGGGIDGVELTQNARARLEPWVLACILAGRNVSYSEDHERGPRVFPNGRTLGSAQRWEAHAGVSRPHAVAKLRPQIVEHDGIVWCPTIANGSWLARRHGKVYFTGNSTFANAKEINETTLKLHILPTLQMLCDALTVGVLWPGLAVKAGLDPERVADGELPYPEEFLSVAVHYDASDLVARPDRTKDIIEVYTKDYTQMGVKTVELREALGLDPDTEVDDDELRKRLDAYRLSRVRETIQVAADSPDRVLPIQEGDKAVLPGESEGEGVIQGRVAAKQGQGSGGGFGYNGYPGVCYQLSAAAELTIERALERIGSKVRNGRSGHSSGLSAVELRKIDGCPNGEVPRLLGPHVVGRVLPDGAPIEQDLSAFVERARGWLFAHGSPTPEATASELGQLVRGTILREIRGEDVEPPSPQDFALLLVGRR